MVATDAGGAQVLRHGTMRARVAGMEIPAFAAEVVAAVGDRGQTILYGHLGDGNVHVNVLGPPPDDESVDELVLRLVAAHGGSISAEHGIGVAKRA
jgi:FAD/FMN-containing dehydrogenase